MKMMKIQMINQVVIKAVKLKITYYIIKIE